MTRTHAIALALGACTTPEDVTTDPDPVGAEDLADAASWTHPTGADAAMPLDGPPVHPADGGDAASRVADADRQEMGHVPLDSSDAMAASCVAIAPSEADADVIVVPLDDERNAGTPPPTSPWLEVSTGATLTFTTIGAEAVSRARFPLETHNDPSVQHALGIVATMEHGYPSVYWDTTIVRDRRWGAFGIAITGTRLAWAMNLDTEVAVTMADGTREGSQQTIALSPGESLHARDVSLALSPSGRRALVAVDCEVWLIQAGVEQATPVLTPPEGLERTCATWALAFLDEEHAIAEWSPNGETPVPGVRFVQFDVSAGMQRFDARAGVELRAIEYPWLSRFWVTDPDTVVIYQGVEFPKVLWRPSTGDTVMLRDVDSMEPLANTAALGRLVFHSGRQVVSYALDGTDRRAFDAPCDWGLVVDATRRRLMGTSPGEVPDEDSGLLQSNALVAVDPLSGAVEPLSETVTVDALTAFWLCPDGRCVIVQGDAGGISRLDLPESGDPPASLVPLTDDESGPGILAVLGDPPYVVTSHAALPVYGGARLALSFEGASPEVSRGGLAVFDTTASTRIVAPRPGGGPALELAPTRDAQLGTFVGKPGSGPWVHATQDGVTWETGYAVASADHPSSDLEPSRSGTFALIEDFAYFAISGGLEVWDLRGDPHIVRTFSTPIELNMYFEPPFLEAVGDDPRALYFAARGFGRGFVWPLDDTGGPIGDPIPFEPPIDSGCFYTHSWDLVSHQVLAVEACNGELYRADLDLERPPVWTMVADETPELALFAFADGGRIALATSYTFSVPDDPLFGYDMNGNGPGAGWQIAPAGFARVPLGAPDRAALLLREQRPGDPFGVAAPSGPGPCLALGRLHVARTTGEDVLAPPPLVADPTFGNLCPLRGSFDRGTLLVRAEQGESSVLGTACLYQPGIFTPLAAVAPDCCEYARIDSAGGAIEYATFGHGADGMPHLDVIRRPLDGRPARVLRLPGLSHRETRIGPALEGEHGRWLTLTVGADGVAVPLDFDSPRAAWRLRPGNPSSTVVPVRFDSRHLSRGGGAVIDY